VVKIGTVPIGRDSFTLIAGPCAVENEEQTMTAVKAREGRRRHGDARRRLQTAHARPTRSKASASRGLEILQEARRRFGLPFVVEVVDVSQVAHVADVADCIRIGTRNAQNFELLKRSASRTSP
jgi:3-deoxy-7-phosphoheptulonate synthase